MLKRLILVLPFLMLTCSIAKASDFCKIDNILNTQSLFSNCVDNKMIFGYINFATDKINLNYKYDEILNLKIPVLFYSEVYNFIEKHCYKENDLRIKEITNLNFTGKKKYFTKIIVSCRYKL